MNLSRYGLAALAVAAIALAAIVVVNRETIPPPVDRPAPAALPPATDGQPDAAWVSATSRSTAIGRRALGAYARAALRVDEENPECRLAWNTLAAIANAESNHGMFGGASIDGDGVARPSIIGVPLDGSTGLLAIRDTDGGELDDDKTWDRAVGPFQFIPSTWKRWGIDGDGDGAKNPQDIEDAALAAGRYLCESGGDLGESRGWSAAVLTYNRSVAYATKVARTATTYADAI
ncbi:MAG: lytic murein transglycosylase [Kineosporiaceae bacterium]|nr:lytic murein transglycosylase [Aeromicrobium sp.]